MQCECVYLSLLSCSQRLSYKAQNVLYAYSEACTRHKTACIWLQEVMLVGITAPLYAVHSHARSWRPLDSAALLLCIAGAQRRPHEVHVLGICLGSAFN